MTVNEVVSIEEDKEVDHTYEVLPFEADEERNEATTQGGQGSAADDGQEAAVADI